MVQSYIWENRGLIMSPLAAGPSVLNPGDIMRSLVKLDMMADIVIPGHDPELLSMKVIPDDHDL